MNKSPIGKIIILINWKWDSEWLSESFVVQWLLSKEMNAVTRVQNQDEAVCIFHSADNLGKGMNPKFSLQLWMNCRSDNSLTLEWQPV